MELRFSLHASTISEFFMLIYWQIAKFSLLKYIIYPTETLAIIIENLVRFSTLVLFWFIYTESSTSISLNEIIAYFLVSGAINSLVFARGYKFGRTIQKSIKSGDFNNFLLRPIRLLPHLFTRSFIGAYGSSIVIGIIYLIIGVLILPPESVENIFVFILFFIVAIGISLSLNILMACIQFYTNEAGSIKNVLDHITRVFSGALIPIYLLPENFRVIVEALPFSGMIFGPTNALLNPITSNSYSTLLISFIWAIILFMLAMFVWNKSLKHYDGVGI
jgi:ABC-type uncharacterized transport system permease subunit